MKNYNQDKRSPKKQPASLNMIRELRGNAVQLQMPTSNKPGAVNQFDMEDPTYGAAQQHQYFSQHDQNDGMNPQRSPLDFDGPGINVETPQIMMTQREQQHAYVNAHGGGLIPPANFSENPFTSYLKSIGATVGQVQSLNPKFDTVQHEPKLTTKQRQDAHISLSQQSSSRNQRRQGAQSLQPLPKTRSTQEHFNDQSEAGGFSRIQLKDKLSRNVTQTIDHDSKLTARKKPVDILTNNLEPNEIRALRVANPLHHAFNKHLGAVITSVQNRRKHGNMEQSQMLAIEDGQNQQTDLALNRSEADAFVTQSNRVSHQLALDDSQVAHHNELVPFVQNTPSKIIQDAKRELALISKQEKAKGPPKPYSMFKAQIKDEFVPQQRAVDQVADLLGRVNRNRDQVFIPLELEHDSSKGGVKFRDAANQEEVKGGQIVFTKNGFISMAREKKQQTEVITKEAYIQEGVQQMVLNQVPFFRKFTALKIFKQWKKRTQRNTFQRNREKLARNFIFSKPVFSKCFKSLIQNANEVRYLKLIDTKTGVQYGKHQTHQFDSQCNILCKEAKEDLEKGLKQIWRILEGLKAFIVQDDHGFIERCKESEVNRIINEKPNQQELVPMTITKAAKDAERKERDLMHLRQNQYNALVQLISRILYNNLCELLFENKLAFTKMFTAPKAQTHYEISLCLDSIGKLTTTPTPQEHRDLFKKVFLQMEETLFKNYFLTAYFQDLVQMFFWEDKMTNPPGALLMRRQISEIETHIAESEDYLRLDKRIDQQLDIDLQKLDEQLLSYAEVEEVYSFTNEWHERRRQITQKDNTAAETTNESSVSQEIEFYNSTWAKLNHLNALIDTIPVSHSKFGTILLETSTLKKTLAEMPKQIDESIRTNVTQTIDNETKILKEELSSTSDTLDKLPTTLNVYVDQVNTLKYLKEKQKDFDKKFDTIEKLQQQCKQDNIKISLKIQLNIEEVAILHRNLPKLKEKAREGLQANKASIEQSMFRSSEGLSLKIKAFEKKYVETYLQDKTRLERCKETLDELLRRSQAVLEMKSKVVLYKEFLKILYEDDQDKESKLEKRQLSCAKDCDFMEEIHKNTIKMWKVFLYWNKKRHQCFTTPFLEFDLKIILKAINKVTKFLNEQSSQSEVVAYKAQPITRSINTQVKDTSVIVEFVKEMNKDTLKRRHWFQIFSLLKAPHLKNSTSFTIVDLREYNIQNNANDVRAIIDHANTEAKYENVFLTIRQEWEQSNLKIVPFKEQINDYVIASSELMSDAIEDNLSTLDTIARSPYASHVKSEIEELIQKLKTMLEHLLLWTQAQKYWLTLDPIYNSGLFRNFFKEHTQDFLDTRASFRRIMWSSFRRPKTTYNLMIKDRLPVFQHLIHFYAMIQKQTNNYLEQKRLLFSRFYFLNDSQFLDLMMLSNSNQDFNVYVNMLFPGANKLFVTRLLKEDDIVAGQSAFNNYEYAQAVEPDYLLDLEEQLETFIQQGRKRQTHPSQKQLLPIQEEEKENAGELVSVDQYNFDKLDNILAKPVLDSQTQQKQKELKGDKENFQQHPQDLFGGAHQEESDDNTPAAESDKHTIGFDGDSIMQFTNKPEADESNNEQLQVYKDLVSQKQALFNQKHKDLAMNQSTQDFIVLGFVSHNKELFLFDQHVSMSKPLESWLSETELAMQDALRKQMIDSIENFTQEPIEEWILDYPQQVAMTTLHLILSQEVTDILMNTDYAQEGNKISSAPSQAQEEGKEAGKDDKSNVNSGENTQKNSQATVVPNSVVKGYEEVAIQIGQKDPSQQEGEGKKKRNKLEQKEAEKKAQVIIRKRLTWEPETEPEEQQVLFLDETFGEQANIENLLEKAVSVMKQDSRYHQATKKSALNVRKPDYKEQVLQVLQHKGLMSLQLRLQFWINKMIRLLHTPKTEYTTKSEKSLEMPGVQKMRLKNIIMFLRHQAEQVESLVQLRVTNVNDFEWQSKLRMTWTNDYEAQAVCGGWTLNVGYEYLGSQQRLILNPLSQRYFVFMASALREKQSAILQCSGIETTGAEIAQEFASMCMLPFKSHQCTLENSLSSLTQLLNGAAMANTWVFFEHLDNLPLERLQIILKEIQLLHEQFIVSGFSRNMMKERMAKQSGLEFTQMSSASLAGANKRNQMVTLGIFASTNHNLRSIKNSKSHQNFLDQTRASFRSIALAKPNILPILHTLLLSENFSEYRSQANIISKTIARFFELKQYQLRESIENGNNPVCEQFDLCSMSKMVKIATMIRNQEFKAYMKAKLQYRDDKEKAQAGQEKREVWVELNDVHQYEIRKKLRDHWQAERAELTQEITQIEMDKFRMELDALAEAFRQVSVQKYLPEFQREESYQNRNMKNQRYEVKEQENNVEELIVQAFTETVNKRKQEDEFKEKEKEKVESLNLDAESAPNPYNAGANAPKETTQLVTSDKLQQTRGKMRPVKRDNLIGFEVKLKSKEKNMHRAQLVSRFAIERQLAEEKQTKLFVQGLKQVATDLHYDLNEEQVYNCIGVLEAMKRSKGIVLAGPICTGKTQMIKLITMALKKTFKTNLRTSYISPDTFTREDLYGPVLAFDQSSLQQMDQPLQPKSVFQIILNTYSRERKLMTQDERDKSLQAIFIDQQELTQEVSDAFKNYIHNTNVREREYFQDMEFILDLDQEQNKVQPGLVQNVPVRFSNGNVTLFPSDLLMFFETQSLKNASPSFLSSVAIVNTQPDDIQYQQIFFYKIKVLKQKHEVKLADYQVEYKNVKDCCKDFVLPFMKNLNKHPGITAWSLWDIKSLTLQFFNQLDAQLYKLEEWAAYFRVLDDGSFPIEEMQRDAVWNIILSAVVWSFGACLNKELRSVFDDQFGIFKSKFNITFAANAKIRYKLFDIFYDIQKLTWSVFTEKLEYKLKSYFEPALQALLIPTQQISQAFYMLDTQVSYMRADKSLDKSFRLIGPSSSSKTVILNTFAAKMQAASHSVSVPMSAYLTLDLFKNKVEDNYRKKRESALVPRDPSKQILLIIDDIHLQKNLKVELLEFIRSWCFCRGYFSVDQGSFKKIADFGCIMAENYNFVPTTKKKDRFLYYATTMYTEEIPVDQYKLFIQSWLTSNYWPVSSLVTKYYLLISNSLMMLIEKMESGEATVGNFTFSALTSFHFVSKFCQNLVLNCSITDNKSDVYGFGAEANARKEEEAVADLFCYEVMRTFGDRMMRPSAKQFLLDKLAYIVQKEFLCEENYNTAYLEQLVLGNYHNKEEAAHHKLTSLMTPYMREEACAHIRTKVKKMSGNSFLTQLLDSPQGLADCYRVSRVLYKPQQHLIILGQSGTSKLEMLQLAAVTNNVPLFEVEAETFGAPLQFAYNLRQVLLTVAKMNKSSFIVVNDQTVRDPVYFDYLYNFMSQLSRHESFVMFDDQFFIDLAAIEAQHIKKMKKVAVPDEYTLFKQGVQKLQKHVHFVFIFSDPMTYKEIIQMYPQIEYTFEVIYMEDLTQQDYLDMANSYLRRANVPEEILGDDQQFAKSLVEVRNRVKTLLLKNFYSPQMLRFTVREEYHTRGASEYIFNDGDKLNLNIYTGSSGYQVSDDDLQQTVLNLPLEVTAMNKHRFGIFCEVTKFLFDLMSMHLSSRKSYYETFLAKSRQFHKYFSSVKQSKAGLHDDQSNHSFRVAMATDKIKEINTQIQDKLDNIKKKHAEIDELTEELNLAEEEVETVIMEKNWKLDRTIEDLQGISIQEFAHVANQDRMPDLEVQLLKVLNIVVLQEHEVTFVRREAVSIFLQKDEFINILDDRRQKQFSRPIFDKLHEFVANRVSMEFQDKPLMFTLFNYVVELYRKMNIKNTMSSTFGRIKEIRSQIDSNEFSIQYAHQSIESKKNDLKQFQNKLRDLEHAGAKLSKKIEEAELSFMRTDQVFQNIEEYSIRLEHKLQSITSRAQTLLGDSILLGCSVVYLGMFAPEEREQFRAQVIDYLVKVRNISCNKMWTEVSSAMTANPNKSMFIQVLKDLGLRDILYKHNMPGVLSNHQFGEALFTMLFAPSCPVICDPTGVMEDFVKEKLLANMDPQVITATDIEAQKKLHQNMASNKPSIVLDVNSHLNQKSGLTIPHCIMKVLSNPLYNGVDFDPKRLGQAKKIGSMGSYLSHATSQNKRIPIVSAALEHISLYQSQIFQPRFDFQLNQDYLQNATFVCAAPSLVIENRVKLEDNLGIVRLKELLIERLLPSSFDFIETKQTLKVLNKKLLQLERAFENAFLIASSDTFRNMNEYSSLRASIEDIIEAREQKELCLNKYRHILKRVKLVTEASDVLFQMYLVLKQVGKQTNVVTYSWQRYLQLLDGILAKLVENMKLEALKSQNKDEEEIHDVEIEIDNSFFKRRFVPTVHQTLVASLESHSVPLFNFFLSLRLAHTYKAISALEHQFILKQLVDLKGYKNWRNPQHSFINLKDTVDKTRHQSLRRELLRLYPDVARQVFDQIEKNLGQQFQYVEASIFIQKELKEKYNLTQVQQLTFGFLCPDTEFKSKLTLFMYTQNMATFDFTEEINPLGDFLTSADVYTPIALKSTSKINPINLITTLAHTQGRSLIVLRTDPSYQAHKFNTQVFNLKLTDKINSQLLDYATVRQNMASSVDDRPLKEQSKLPVDEKEIISKQLWLGVKQRDVNLDEGRIFFQQTENQISAANQNNPHIQQITDAAIQGNWVLLCPVQFPHFFGKLLEKLHHMKEQNQIDSNFRLIVDLQNYQQNEVPDSFYFHSAMSFCLSEGNMDRITTLNDIWSKILNPALLEKLTDQEYGNENLKEIEFKPEGTTVERHAQFMQVYSKEVQDQNSINLFNKFIERSTVDFTNKLKFQRVQTLERMKAEKEARLQRELEAEAAKAQQLEPIKEDIDKANLAAYGLESASSKKSVTADSQGGNSAIKLKENEAADDLKQEVAALDLASKVAAVGEQEGARLDYDAQQAQAEEKPPSTSQ